MGERELIANLTQRLALAEQHGPIADGREVYIRSTDLRAAVEALASRPAVAEGWVLVPREPTEAMINAAIEGGPSAATKAATNSLDRLVSLTVDIWTAFLSAAPKP